MTTGARLRVMLGAAFVIGALPILAEPTQQQPPSTPAGDVDVIEKTIPELQAAMAAGEVTSRELVAAFLARINAYDHEGPRLNTMIAMSPDALGTAAALDREREEQGPRGPLHGIPIVIKDNYETADMPTTGGSIALAGFETGRDAFQVRRLREAGAVILGKTNLHELAAGIITISSLGGQTRNPYDPARTPGGSSGGTGAAVAASFAVSGMASDTCGSIRIPAANNNLFGLRGTLGLSSRTGIIPLSHTQDIGGPLARTVTDLAIMLDATVGPDPADQATRASDGHIPPSYRDALDGATLQGARVGILLNLFGTAPEDEEVTTIVRKALDAMEAQGATLVEVTIPGLDEPLAGSSLIALEFKTDLIEYLAQFPDAPVESLVEIVETGQLHVALVPILSTRSVIEPDADAIRVVTARRAAVAALVQAAFDEHQLDVLAYPTLRRRPVVFNEPQRGTNCQLSATTGLPALSMPAGFTDDGVPIGLEVLGPAWSEAELLRMAYAYEQAVDPRRPPPTTPALVDGKPPVPVSFTVAVGGVDAPVEVALRYDPVSGHLQYEWSVPVSSLLSATLHRGDPSDGGPVIARLFNPAAPAVGGHVVLPPYQRPELEAGHLFIAVRQAGTPTKQSRVRLP